MIWKSGNRFGYWYRRAGKPVASGSLEAEWQQMVSTLLVDGKA
jgi:hypothetical protein